MPTATDHVLAALERLTPAELERLTMAQRSQLARVLYYWFTQADQPWRSPPKAGVLRHLKDGRED